MQGVVVCQIGAVAGAFRQIGDRQNMATEWAPVKRQTAAGPWPEKKYSTVLHQPPHSGGPDLPPGKKLLISLRYRYVLLKFVGNSPNFALHLRISVNGS